mmetsp:Transcript_95562/g.169692  ORF Transcript_95562/g.169692 Transcript_95562/m.169692 type:complete len:755 (-) Transcript_95562:210-2474(-)
MARDEETDSTAAFTDVESNATHAGEAEDPANLVRNATASRPLAHHLPGLVSWSVTLLTAFGIGSANFLMLWSCHFLFKWKFELGELFKNYTDISICLAAVSAATAGIGAALVIFAAPICSGGQMPEVKGYLNGNHVPNLFSTRTLIIRFLGTVLAVSSGLPIGREGPTIALGCTIGVLLMRFFAGSHVKHMVEIESSAQSRAAAIVDEERFAQAQRVACIQGGAAGMAAIFNGPIGGLLYMLEEVSITCWASELTFRTFVCSVVSVLVNFALLNLSGKSDTAFLIFYDYKIAGDHPSWSWLDMPFFVILAALLGLFSRFYTTSMVAVFQARMRALKQRRCSLHGRKVSSKVVQLAECMAFAAFVAIVFSLLSLLGRCESTPAGAEVIRLNCPEGEYNPVATLLLNLPEKSIALLYAEKHAGKFRILALVVAFLGYTSLAVCVPGLPLPTGSFIPAMFIGALVGKAFGKMLTAVALFHITHDGVYALVGSASLLGAFTHQTLAIVVFLVECVNDLSLIPPLMVAIAVSYLVTKVLSKHGFDEELIMLKDVPFLDRKAPEGLKSPEVTAEKLSVEIRALPPRATATEVEEVLQQEQHTHFPIVSRHGLLGLVSRTRLEALAQELRESPSASAASGSIEVPDERRSAGSGREASTSSQASTSAPATSALPLFKIMDAAPWTVLPNTPAARLYPLFSRLGANAACVISSTGTFHGVLTRKALLNAGEEDWRLHRSSSWLEWQPSAEEAGSTVQSHVLV